MITSKIRSTPAKGYSLQPLHHELIRVLQRKYTVLIDGTVVKDETYADQLPEELDLSRNSTLVDVFGLRDAVQLVSLNLRMCKFIQDISWLSSLTILRTLNIGWCKGVKDISVLGRLTSLRSLTMHRVSWLTNDTILNLATLTELRDLDIGGTRISDISVLGFLTKLVHLNMNSCNHLVDITVLNRLPELETLSIICCKRIVYITSLIDAPALVYLDIRGCKAIKDVTSLENRDIRIKR